MHMISPRASPTLGLDLEQSPSFLHPRLRVHEFIMPVVVPGKFPAGYEPMYLTRLQNGAEQRSCSLSSAHRLWRRYRRRFSCVWLR